MKELWRKCPEKFEKSLQNLVDGWNDEKTKERRLKAMVAKQKVSKIEKKVADVLCCNFPDMIHATADGIVIGGKVPDFIDFKNKIIVELFGEWYHDQNLNPTVKDNRTADYTVNHYAKYGFKTLIVWNRETKVKGWEKRLISSVWNLRKTSLLYKKSIS